MIWSQIIGAISGILGIFMLMLAGAIVLVYPSSAVLLLLVASPLLIKAYRWAKRTKMPSPITLHLSEQEFHATPQTTEEPSPFHLTLNGVPAHFTNTEPRCPMCHVDDRRDEVTDGQRSLVRNSLDD